MICNIQVKPNSIVKATGSYYVHLRTVNKDTKKVRHTEKDVIFKGYGLFSLRLIGSAIFGTFSTWLHVLDYRNFWNTER